MALLGRASLIRVTVPKLYPVAPAVDPGRSSGDMTDWTEATLRNAASWQAFKEGKGLHDSGAVIAAAALPGGWQGTVRAGGRPMKVTVTVKSPTDLETRCACPDNRRSGALCAHAIATGLSILAGGPREKKPVPVVSQAPALPVAWEILLPPGWRDGLARGVLSATLKLSPDSGISDSDDRFTAWLAGEKQAPKPQINLQLSGPPLSGFLAALVEHPRVVAGKERAPVEVGSGGRLPLAEAEHAGEMVRLTPGGDRWIEILGTLWQAGDGRLSRAGEGIMPAELAAPLRLIAAGKPVDIATGNFFENLGAWQEWLRFPQGSWLDSLHFIPARETVELSLEGSLNHLEARVRIRYGDAPPVPPGLGKIPGLPRLAGDCCEIRNLAGEERAIAALERAGFQPTDLANGCWVLKGESSMVDFLTRTLPGLRDGWTIIEGERFSKVRRQVAVVSPKIEILGSGEDWLSFNLTFQTNDGIVIPAAEVRRLLRGGSAAGKSAGGRHLVISDEVENLIDPLFSELEIQQESGHFRASARAGELVREIQKKISKPLNSSDSNLKIPYEKPATLHADLRPYQEAGAGWLWDRVERFGGALLADDMGLGKTIQTIALIERLFSANDKGIVLVIATASLLGNWNAEFARFAPGRTVRILHGAGREVGREKVRDGDVILTSYGTLARDLAWHLKRDYLAVIVDEASLMRNPDTDHAKAVSKLKSTRRIALTGTPVENGVRDLWSIFRFVQPGWLGGREEFRDRYEAAIAGGESAAAVTARLRLKTSPFLLRRTKEQVAPELPSKIFIDEFCDLTADQQAVYRDVLAEGRKRVEAIRDSGNPGAARMQMLTALLRLRQTCCDLALLGNDRWKQLLVPRRSAKLQRLLELLQEAVSGGHRVLIFSQFRTQLLEIEIQLGERGWASLRLDGQTRHRQRMVDEFQNPAGPPIFLISLKAGGYGLNLTAADIVIHFDPWWNPAAEAQATDRAHRIGQTRPVTVYRLLTRGTVEEKVVRLQARKREMAAAIDETGAADASGWSVEELMEVMG